MNSIAKKLLRSVISNAYAQSFFRILKHTKTRAISAHRQRAYAFGSFISFSFQHQSRKSARAYAFRSGLIFTLTAAVTTSYKQCVEKPTRPPRFRANTNIRALFHPGFSIFVNCLTLTIIRHHVRISIIRSIIRAKIPHAHAKSHSAYQRSYIHVHFTQDKQFNRVEPTMHLACYSEQHNTHTHTKLHAYASIFPSERITSAPALLSCFIREQQHKHDKKTHHNNNRHF